MHNSGLFWRQYNIHEFLRMTQPKIVTCLSCIFAVTGLSLYSYVEIIPGPKLDARENFFWIQPEPWCRAEMAPYHGVW